MQLRFPRFEIVCRVLILLLALAATLAARAQVLEQVISPEFSLMSRAAPAVEVLPSTVPHPGQPESLAYLEEPTIRLDAQLQDLLRKRTGATTTNMDANRLAATYLGRFRTGGLGPLTVALEAGLAHGSEYRNSPGSTLEINQDTLSLRFTGLRGGESGSFQAVQVQTGWADIDGRTSLLASLFPSTPVRPFSIEGSNCGALVTVGRRTAGGGYSARLGFRDAKIPLVLAGQTNRLQIDFQGSGLVWEARGWRRWGSVEGGVLAGMQHLSGDGDVFYNTDRQGGTSAGLTTQAYGIAGSWAYRPSFRLLGQLTHVRAKITGDANMFFPGDSDFIDFLGGTGIINSYLDARATSLYLGWEADRHPVIFRAGYQLAQVDATAGFHYRTQYLGGGVRNEAAEETGFSDAFLHILGVGVEREYPWGRVGYGVLGLVPKHLSRHTVDLMDAPAATRAGSGSDDDIKRGGVVHMVRIEWYL